MKHRAPSYPRLLSSVSRDFDVSIALGPRLALRITAAHQLLLPNPAGLDENNYDKAACQEAFDRYKACKKQEVRAGPGPGVALGSGSSAGDRSRTPAYLGPPPG